MDDLKRYVPNVHFELIRDWESEPIEEFGFTVVVDDILCISDKSRIGSESLKKFTGVEVPVGILVNEPVVMTNGDRKGRVLLLGGLYRSKLSSSQTVKPGDTVILIVSKGKKIAMFFLVVLMFAVQALRILLMIRMNMGMSIVSK